MNYTNIIMNLVRIGIEKFHLPNYRISQINNNKLTKEATAKLKGYY